MKPDLRTIAGAAGAVLVLLFSSCGKPRTEGVVRLIQVLDKANVVRSPLMRLEEGFARITDTVKARDLRPLSVKGESYWVFRTSSRLLGLADREPDEQAVLRQNGVDFRYSETSLPSYPTWRRIKGDSTIEMSGAAPDPAYKGWYKLVRGHTLRGTKMLAGGRTLFDLVVKRVTPTASPEKLSISVGDRRQDLQVGSSGRLVFAEECASGETQLQITLVGPKPVDGPQTKDFILVRPVRVESASDLILLALPKGQTAPSGIYEFAYVPEPGNAVVPVKHDLAPGKTLEAELRTSAPGPATLEMAGSCVSGPGRIAVRLDSKLMGSVEVPGNGAFTDSLTVTAPAGRHTLKLSYEGERGPGIAAAGAAGPRLDSLIWRNPRLTIDVPLYRHKDVGLKEDGVVANPWNIKKKLKVKGASWNVLVAPSTTILQFEVRVPDSGALRFGYGLVAEDAGQAGDGVEFEVTVGTGAQRKTVFSAVLDPARGPAGHQVLFGEADLAAYAGRKVDLVLSTHSPRRGGSVNEENQDRRGDFAFWANPVLVSKAGPVPGRKKHIILVSMDATRPDHLGCYGYERHTSPTLDEVAADAALFQNAYSQASYTLASHMTMLTGEFPTTHHVFHMTDALGASIPTLAERLQARGLLTAAFTGGGLMDARYGYARGFDEFHDRIISQEARDVVGPLWQSVSSWLERNKDQEFFLFLHSYQVHNPYRAPAPLGTMFLDKDATRNRVSLEDFIGAGYVHKYAPLSEPERRNVIALYDGGIRYLDEYLLRPLVDDLKRLGLYDDTLLILTADHGEEFFDHLTWGHSNTLYNELLRVPLIVRFPGGRFRGERVARNARLADIVPTVLDELGLTREARGLDGASLVPLLEGKDKGERFCLSYLPDNIFADPMPSKIALIQGRYKIILNDKYPARAYTYFTPTPPEMAPIELYDLQADPLEKHNLVTSRGDIARRMIAELQPYLESARGQGSGSKASMDKELEERLRALGYIK